MSTSNPIAGHTLHKAIVREVGPHFSKVEIPEWVGNGALVSVPNDGTTQVVGSTVFVAANRMNDKVSFVSGNGPRGPVGDPGPPGTSASAGGGGSSGTGIPGDPIVVAPVKWLWHSMYSQNGIVGSNAGYPADITGNIISATNSTFGDLNGAMPTPKTIENWFYPWDNTNLRIPGDSVPMGSSENVAIGLQVGDRIAVMDWYSWGLGGVYVITSLGSVSTPWVLTRATDLPLADTYKNWITTLENATYSVVSIRGDAVHGDFGAHPMSALNWWGPYNVSGAVGEGSSASGYGSVAAAAHAVASGSYSVAFGILSSASGTYSIASEIYAQSSGGNAKALNTYAVASGENAKATGYGSVASGNGAISSGYNSVASGVGSVASGLNAVASGAYATASGSNSVAMSPNSVASMPYQIIPSGKSIAFGVIGPLVVGTVTSRWYVQTPLNIASIIASVGTPSTGDSVRIVVYQNGSTIFTGYPSYLQIIGTEYVSSSVVPAVISLAVGDYLTFGVTQVGSTTPGSDLSLQIDFA